MKRLVRPMYRSVTLSRMRLKRSKKPDSNPFLPWSWGRNSMLDRAGLRVSATIAEMVTEMAMVIANCW
ncbi:hypothetical protein D3C81_1944230 [compost metagenome]